MAMKTMISLKTIKKESVALVEEFKNNIQIYNTSEYRVTQ